jgi:peptidoglycan hydrolase-like protein with peptidoglycan-binding domain
MAKMKKFTFPDAVGLALGTSDQDVKKLQKFLQHFGYLRLSSENLGFVKVREASNSPEATTGQFDHATKTALENFQTFHGLPKTGVLDEPTIVQMSLPRCGFPDIPSLQGIEEFVAQGNKWDKTHLTYGFQELAHELTLSQVRGAIQAALGLWSSVTPLTFQEVDMQQNPDFVIRFVSGNHGDDSPFDGVGNVLAHAFYPPPNGGDIAGDAHFDEGETWSVAIPVPTDAFDLVTVAAHEFGHSLGLAHSNTRGALMFPSYGGPQRFLTQDDVDGIQSIYGSGISPISLP